MNLPIAATSSLTLANVPRWMAWRELIPKNTSQQVIGRSDLHWRDVEPIKRAGLPGLASQITARPGTLQ